MHINSHFDDTRLESVDEKLNGDDVVVKLPPPILYALHVAVLPCTPALSL